MNTIIAATLIAVVALSIPFLLVWWRIADRWAESERHRRFKPRGPDPKTRSDATVIKRHGSSDQD